MTPQKIKPNLISSEVLKYLNIFQFKQDLDSEIITQEDVIFWLKLNFNIWIYCRASAKENTWESVIVKLSPNKLEKITSEEDSPEKSINSAFLYVFNILVPVIYHHKFILNGKN